ncbi:HNH/ENDO VII family nuclease [Oceanobacillus sp. FSL H7-0719]|uniref:HNH/ENDO VII family nuclease n=1 Tax=Oceanobacillus sp. FSL H7-0719 TaxID=2954507 RepID=UPI003246D12B
MDVKYIPADWNQMKSSIGELIGKGVYGKGMIDDLKDVTRNLEGAESDIARYDSDGVVRFSHIDRESTYQEIFEDCEVMRDFTGKVGDIVDRTIDQPFYEDIDAFVSAMQQATISKYTTKNRIGLTDEVTHYAQGMNKTMRQPKAEVSLDDLLSGDNFYASHMRIEYDMWKAENLDQDFSQEEYRMAAVNMNAFEYNSIEDQQLNKEFWVNIAALVTIVGTTVLAVVVPPVGVPLTLTIGTTFGALELKAAVTGKDWASDRGLGSGERALRGSLASLDFIPVVGAVTRFATGIRLGSRVLSRGRVAEIPGLKSTAQNGLNQVGNMIHTAGQMTAQRVKSAGLAIKDAANVAKNKLAKDIQDIGKVADSAITSAKNITSTRKVVLAGDVGKVHIPAKNTHFFENKAKQLYSKAESVPVGGTKGTGKLNSTKDIYKVSPKDIYQALEGYEQTHKFKAHFRGFEVKAQRSLSHMSDKQLIYSFKKGYSPKDGANDTIVLHHHEQKVEGPIIEMPSRYHDLGNKKQHPFGNSGGVGSGEARIEFNKWRKEYWKARYANEMIKRGIIE